MISKVEAVYENGVFKPLHSVGLSEGEKVTLIYERIYNREEALRGMESASRFREEMFRKYGYFPDSTPDIAEDRMRDV